MPLLGLKDELIPSGSASWDTNKIGGKPDWIHQGCPEPTCPNCGCSMIHIIQLYCPLGGSPYHRTLYVFSCPGKKCWGRNDSWCVLRSQMLDASFSNEAVQMKLIQKEAPMFEMEDDWGDSDEDWPECGMDPSGMVKNNKESDSNRPEDLNYAAALKKEGTVRNQFEENHGEKRLEGNTYIVENEEDDNALSELKALNLHSGEIEEETDDQDMNVVEMEDSNVSEKDVNNMLSVLHCKHSVDVEQENTKTPSGILVSYFLNVFEESTEKEDDSSHLKKLLSDYERNEGVDLRSFMDTNSSASGKGSGMTESYEKTVVKHGDKTFHRFLKQVSRCPEQCIRYDWNGAPLYITSVDDAILHAASQQCKYCSKPLVFELQLMPALVNALKFPENADPACEFGTVLLYTCQESCWKESDTYRQEVVFVQADPDQHLFKK